METPKATISREWDTAERPFIQLFMVDWVPSILPSLRLKAAA